MVTLAAIHRGDIGSRRAVERRIGDAAHRQEVRPQAPDAQLGHVGQRLADTAAEHEAAQLLVETGHVEVPDEGLGADPSETDPVALPEGDLEVQTGSQTCHLSFRFLGRERMISGGALTVRPVMMIPPAMSSSSDMASWCR